ncbi:AAA family ATPase [Almyronema epifaneia]|uniref:AAA family ATPase n=1 Tax=Almyronema epifaneia S1 TaxID=2991925 RepID=A0ABW6IJP8_9CYAN
MPTIAFINQKGGVGKSTTSLHLTCWLARKKKTSVMLIDADVQRSSSRWLSNMTNEIPHIAINNPNAILDKIPELAERHDYLVIDGPAGLQESVRAILLRADLAICPVQASALDLESAGDATYLIKQAQSVRNGLPEAALFLSRAVRGTRLATESYSVLENSGITTLKTIIFQRQVLADAPGQVATVFDMPGDAAKTAAKEYQALFKEVMGMLP